MSKPWRMAALIIGASAIAALLLTERDPRFGLRLTVLDMTCVVIVLGCVQTIGVRLARMLCEVRDVESMK